MSVGLRHLFVVVTLLALTTLTRTDVAPASQNAGHGINPENRAPLQSFVLNQYQGSPVDLASYRGRVVLVNFWATWCAPCVAEFSSLLALKDGFAGRPFEILAINMGERDEVIASFFDTLEHEVNFPVLVDRPVITVAERWPVRALPTTIIVDKTGNLGGKVRGGRAWNSAESRAIINPFLHE